MSNNSSRGGLGALEVLGIVFIVLKLVGTIDWSWWWVLLPYYGPIVFVIALIIVVGSVKAISDL